MFPDLQNFCDQTTDQIAARLLSDGYTEIEPHLFRTPFKEYLLRISTTPDLTAAFCRACQTGWKNPYLPKIFHHIALRHDLHLSVSENLMTVDEFAPPLTTVLSGHARAVSSLFEGDEMHADVHRCMADDVKMRRALRKIVYCALTVKDPVAIDPRGVSILFRENNGTCETVFARPLVAQDDLPRADCIKKLRWIERRFSDAERNAPSSPYWR